MPAREVDLDGHRGLLWKERGARALYVFAHGAGAGIEHPFMAGLAGLLSARGIATLRWEFPYMTAGRKRPDRAELAEQSARRVWAASKRHARGVPRFAGGKSFGGRMTSRAHAASAFPDLRGLIFVGFPLHPPDQPGTERADHLARAGGPLLFLQGTRDELADLALLRPVVKRLGRRATLHILDGAGHGFSRKRDLPDLAGAIAAWIDRILDSA